MVTPCLAAGQPSPPQNVQIKPGRTQLTITWNRPQTDTAANYIVQIYANDGANTFGAGKSAAGTWSALPWNNQPAVTTGTLVYNPSSAPHYTFTTPTLSVNAGEPLAVSCGVAQFCGAQLCSHCNVLYASLA